MPYSTGTATSFADLLGSIEAFLTANGWTKTGSVVHKGNVFVEMVASADQITIQSGTGESGGALVDPAPNKGAINAVCNGPDIAFPVIYHLFIHAAPDCFVCVVNYSVLRIQWLMAGELDKFGTWTGGAYSGGSYHSDSDVVSFDFKNYAGWAWSSIGGYRNSGLGMWWATKSDSTKGNISMRCELDGNTWVTNGEDSTSPPPDPVFISGNRLTREAFTYSPNAYNNQAILAPVLVALTRPSSQLSILGTPGHVRLVNIRNHDIADIVQIGTDKWMVFPHMAKSNDPLQDPLDSVAGGETGLLGFAVRYDGP